MPEKRPAPGPWAVEPADDNTAFWVVAPPPPRPAPLQFDPRIHVAGCEELADALFIGDACNFHDKLVAALRQLLRATATHQALQQPLRESVKNAQQVLAELEVEVASSTKALAEHLKECEPTGGPEEPPG